MVGLEGYPFAKAGNKGEREPSEDWRGGSAGKAVVMKTQGSEFRSPVPRHGLVHLTPHC